MRVVKAVEAKDFDFDGYGWYYNFFRDQENILYYKNDEFEDRMTKNPIIDTEAYLGYTVGAAAPYLLTSMERHDHTREALFCQKEPVVLTIAKRYDEIAPRAEDVRAVILRCGDIVVLDRNIWHDACHGINKSTVYYYLASRGKEPAKWIKIKGEKVKIEI